MRPPLSLKKTTNKVRQPLKNDPCLRLEFENHQIVGEVRNVGMLGAIELVENKEKKVQQINNCLVNNLKSLL